MKTKINKREISVERTIGGYWRCSTVANGERISAAYNGYTKREAVADFLREVNGVSFVDSKPHRD